MKKNLYSLILICALFSCKKDHSGNIKPTPTAHKVTFQVAFSAQTTKFVTSSLHTQSLTITSLSDTVDVIYYAVYDSVGTNLHIIKQVSTDSGFGSYTDNLNPGKYTIVVAAGKTGMLLGRDGTASSKLSTDIIYYTGTKFNQDAFYKKFALTVGNTSSSNPVTLDRITSELTFIIADQIPSGVKLFEIGYNAGASTKFAIGAGTGIVGINLPANEVIALPATAIGTKNYQLSVIFLSTSSTVAAFLSAENGPDKIHDLPSLTNVIAQKVIPLIPCAQNTQTILTGDLFGGNGLNGTGGFTATIDTSWNSLPPITKTFP